MLYWLLKIPASISLWMYCRKLRVNNKAYFNSKGPLLIACNHPDSFLDAIILASLFRRPVYSLARGDAFKNKFYTFLLHSLKMLPVYRTSEGVENMEHNYTTFNACKEIFKKNGIVLIFSEGKCINEWHFRPLMKGTARLAISSWEDGIDLKILPTGINYQSFTIFGKNINLNFSPIFSKADLDLSNGFGKSVQSFNQLLQSRMEPLIYEIDKNDSVSIKKKFIVKISTFKKTALAIPALIGYFIHLPLYYPANKIAAKDGFQSDHYDSILIGILFLSYPFYLLLITLLISYFIGGLYCWLAFIILPFCGWSYMQIKKQF